LTSDVIIDNIRCMRTTLDIDDPILRDLKRLGKKEKKSLGRLASELLQEAISMRKAADKKKDRLQWVAQPMKALVDIDDKEAVYAVLDESPR